MVRRFLNWLLGIPDPQDLDARRRLEAERDHEKDRQRTEAIYQGDKSNLTGPRR